MRETLIAGLLTVCLATRSFAQPAPAAEPDFARATELYNAATQAMTESRFDEAARDFLAAFEITKDPVLFFKIGTAYEKAGKCGDALGYYQRYLTEAKPEESFVTMTRDRIDACRALVPATTPPPASKAAEPPAPAPEPAAPAAPEPAAPAAPEPPPPLAQPSKNLDRAWLFVGGSLAFATAGAVLAYSVSSAEQDVKDLYISNNGMPPSFDDPAVRKRYEQLVDEGERYQYLAWTSFGLAAGCAVGATIFFLRGRGDVSVVPVVTPKETGVSATLRF